MAKVIVYAWWPWDAWQSWENYLLASLWPDAAVIRASGSDTAANVLASLSDRASLFAFHIDYTFAGRFPRERAALVSALEACRVPLVNGGIADTSKHAIQQACAGLDLPVTIAGVDGDPGELVIVKTNLNYGGSAESSLPLQDQQMLGVNAQLEGVTTSSDYRVLPRRDVPAASWNDSRLAIERFVSNRAGRWIRAYFLFDRIFVRQMTNPRAIKKVSESDTERTWRVRVVPGGRPATEDEDPPVRLLDDLGRMRRHASLDFGAVDFVLDEDGTPYLVDVNPTPYDAHSSGQPGLLEHLRLGRPTL